MPTRRTIACATSILVTLLSSHALAGDGDEGSHTRRRITAWQLGLETTWEREAEQPWTVSCSLDGIDLTRVQDDGSPVASPPSSAAIPGERYQVLFRRYRHHAGYARQALLTSWLDTWDHGAAPVGSPVPVDVRTTLVPQALPALRVHGRAFWLGLTALVDGHLHAVCDPSRLTWEQVLAYLDAGSQRPVRVALLEALVSAEPVGTVHEPHLEVAAAMGWLEGACTRRTTPTCRQRVIDIWLPWSTPEAQDAP